MPLESGLLWRGTEVRIWRGFKAQVGGAAINAVNRGLERAVRTAGRAAIASGRPLPEIGRSSKDDPQKIACRQPFAAGKGDFHGLGDHMGGS